MFSNRNKTRKDRVKEKAAPEEPKRREAKKPTCRCGGTGWISKIVHRPAFGPPQHVRTTCSCKNR